MKAIEVENKLREVVARLIVEIELSTKQGRLDVNLVSEDAWIPILKEVFQCPNLKNLNSEKKNYPGIDLGDETDRVAFQVTSTTNLDKIKRTLETFIENGYYRSFDEIYVFTIIDKQKSYSQKSIDDMTKDMVSFDVRRNIIDPGDILEKITSLRIGVQARILEEFQLILGDLESNKSLLTEIEEVPYLLASNLVKVTYPEYLYVAEINIDEKGTIEKAKEQLNLKKNRVSKFTLIKLALLLEGIKSNEWVYHENKLFSFFDLENTPSFENVIDIGTVERIESSYIARSEFTEYGNLLKQLLKNCLRDVLSPHFVDWNKQEKTFYFLPTEDGQEKRKESWTGKKSAIRTVYELKYQKKEPDKLAHHKHLSFDASFRQIDDDWYCVINPSWLYTFNLYKKSKFHDDLLSSQKRLELNPSVRNIVRFLAYYLCSVSPDENGFINFHELMEFQYLSPAIENGDVSEIDDQGEEIED